MYAARQATPVDEERRIRRRMRLDLHLCAKKSPTLAKTLLCGALLFSAGFCVGWVALRLWPGLNRRAFCF